MSRVAFTTARLIAAAFLLALVSAAARADSTPFVITPDLPPLSLSLAPVERVLVDTAGTLTFADVRSLPVERFSPLSENTKLDFAAAYWVRAEVRSGLPVDMEYLFGTQWWDYSDLYVMRADGTVTTLHGGLLKQPRDANDPFYASFYLHAGETVTLVARLKSRGMFRTPSSPTLFLSQAVERFVTFEAFSYFDGMLFGALIALALYNFIFALSTRDPAYFLYSGYLLALAIDLVGSMGMSPSKLNQFFIPDHPLLAMWMKRLFNPIAWIVLLQFNRVYLQTRRNLPWMDRLLIATMVLYAMLRLLFAFGWTDESPFEWLLSVAVYAIALTGILAGVLRYRQGFVPAKYFVAAQLLLGLGLVSAASGDSPWNPLNHLPDGGLWDLLAARQIWVGAVAEGIIFSMGLAYRMNALKSQVARQVLVAEQARKDAAIDAQHRLEVEVADRTRELRLEKENASNLLHNILPIEVADELIAKGATQPQRYDDVSILFTDFRGFTDIVGSLPARKVIEELNDIFQHFDDIIDACGIEKIKTIGDSYLIAGGLPKVLPDHAERCVDVALRMFAYLDERNRTSALKWNMRAGIHSGAVIAGVVGKRKFTYDVWGDTVNVASRMERASEAGRINVSAYTYDLVKSRFQAEYRGKLEVKGKGSIDMYFIVPPTDARAAP